MVSGRRVCESCPLGRRGVAHASREGVGGGSPVVFCGRGGGDLRGAAGGGEGAWGGVAVVFGETRGARGRPRLERRRECCARDGGVAREGRRYLVEPARRAG